MECPRCKYKIQKDWKFCPECGLGRSNTVSFNINDIFSRMRKEMKNTEESMDRSFEAVDLSPFFKEMGKSKPFLIKPQGTGFSIRIVRAGDEKPKVSVKTFGGMERKNVMGEVYDEFNLKPDEKTMETRKTGEDEYVKRIEKVAPKSTEEPESSIKRVGAKVLVDIKLPNVKKKQDIQVKELPNSVEVRALTKDKLYFKILTKPVNSTISNHEFRKGVLHLEFN
ncbi:MAG: zinc ribbon domain-containing protein [Candidatus Aenigmatarchaeota archaeon]